MIIPSIIETKNLNVFYKTGNIFQGKNHVIKDFNLKIEKGQIIGLSGTSGVGKTTLGKSILNLHKYWEGEILWNGKSINELDIKPIRSKYNWMGQEPSLTFNPVKIIESIIRETLFLNGMNDRVRQNEKIMEICVKLKLNDSLLKRYPYELSAGQIQRFALLRILLLSPVFVVLDEPTSSLDPINQILFLQNLKDYQKENDLSVLFISHSKKILKYICNNIIELK
jgi:ABC-type dipeptide/oligopeptide/nickel transport system ATPase subunit